MSDLVPGIDYVFYINDGGIYKEYMCARTMDIPANTDMIETTVTGAGNWKSYEPAVHSYNINLQGVISLDAATNLTFPQLRAMQFAKTKLLWRSVMTSQQGNTYIESGYAYISNSVPTQSFDGISTFSISFQGTGAIVPIITPPPPNTGEVYRYPAAGATAPATPGSYTWATGITGAVPLSIVKDGRGQSDIILSGTPVGNEALYDTTTGDITFAIPFEDVETAPYMLYQNT